MRLTFSSIYTPQPIISAPIIPELCLAGVVLAADTALLISPHHARSNTTTRSNSSISLGSPHAGSPNEDDEYYNSNPYQQSMNSSGRGGRAPGAYRTEGVQLEDRPYHGGGHSPLEIPMGPGQGHPGLGPGTPSDRLQGQPTVRRTRSLCTCYWRSMCTGFWQHDSRRLPENFRKCS